MREFLNDSTYDVILPSWKTETPLIFHALMTQPIPLYRAYSREEWQCIYLQWNKVFIL